jgi:hypothetical protein
MAGARVTSDEELHGGQGGFLIKHVGWMGEKRRQEIQDRPQHVLERTKAWMGGSDGDFAAQKARSAARVDGDGFSSRAMLLSPC